ncbi:MAG: hypothetical protein M1836_005235 [Candelina mexicana]|nr:MAG: hypothetical protein M1836_005235 [Candelina mexicana]
MPTTILPAIATISHGASKLLGASQHDFRGVEIYFPDLMHLAATALPRSSTVSTFDNLPSNPKYGTLQPTDTQQIAAGYLIRRYCEEYKLSVIALQPFLLYESLIDQCQHAKRIKKLRLWLRHAHILGVDLIQIPSEFLGEE